MKSHSLTLTDRRDALLGVEWNKQTRFLENGKTIAATDLKSGERIGVAYVKEGDHLLARVVRVLPARQTAHNNLKRAS